MKLCSNYHQLMANLLLVSIFNWSRDPLLGNWFSEGRYEKIELFLDKIKLLYFDNFLNIFSQIIRIYS